MGSRVDQGSLPPAMPGSANTNGEPPEDEGASDLIHVCRSAMLRRAEYRFYREFLLAFLATGGPPDCPTLHTLARRHGVPLEATLARMASEDLVQRDPSTGAIQVAYPFSGVPTTHRVALFALLAHPSDPDNPAGVDGTPGVQLYAMCALDALGIPLMLHCPALVTSVDPLTGDEVRVRVWQEERAAAGEESVLPGWRADWQPASGVLYARPEDSTVAASDTAAVCRCPVTNFFATHAHARQWAEQHGSPGDVILAPAEALQRADRRFGGILDRLDGGDQRG